MIDEADTHDSTQPDLSGQAFLDVVFERAVRHVEDGLVPDVDALIAGHESLRAEVERLVQLAQSVAVGRPEPLPVISGFTLLQPLGRGGMGTVYLARQHSLGGRPVALKVLPGGVALSTRARARFLAEAAAIARLRHPNIVAVHDVVHQDELYAYAMEWVDGLSLAEVIAAEGTEAPKHEGAKALEIGETCRIGIAIARALEAVHAAGLLHRDVKPSNILLRRDGTPLLADFGLARELDSSVHTQAGHFAGTVAYAPPEQLRGDSPSPPGRGQGEGGVDARSDVYALGVTLYHALALQLPFEARNPAAMLRRIESGAATPLRKVNPRVPRDLATIVATAMEVDPARRYQTAGDLAADLERFINYQPIQARPAGLLTRSVKLVRRNRGAALGVTIGGILAMGLAGLLVTYFFFVPDWAAAHVREARLILLDPVQANSIVSSLYWGRYSRLDSTSWEGRQREYDRALKKYDAALRLAPFDEALRRERTVVQAARDAKPDEEAGARIPSRTHPGRSQSRRGDNPFLPPGATTRAWEGIPAEVHARTDSRTSKTFSDDPRSAGLYDFLTQDYDAALAHWAEYDKSRNPLDTPDALVDAALGILYLFDDQASRAYPRLQHAVEAFPGVRFLMEYLADAAVKCGDADRAEQWLEQSKPISRGAGLGARDRVEAALLAARGRTDEAVAAYRRMQGIGVTKVELARLLDREGCADEALDAWLSAVVQFPKSPRVKAAFVACAEHWWGTLPKPQRLDRIRSTLEGGPKSMLTVLRHYQALSFRDESKSGSLANVAPGDNAVGFQIFDFKFQILAALLGTLSSPPLESLSLNELAERMEVENMAQWTREKTSSGFLKKLRSASVCWPIVRPIQDLVGDVRVFIQVRPSSKQTILGVALLALTAAPAVAQSGSFDATIGTLPQAQGWIFYNDTSPAPVVSNGALHQGPTALSTFQGWAHEGTPMNLMVGFSIEAELNIISSNHHLDGSIHRCGYSIAIIDSVSRVIAVDIAEDGVCLRTTNLGLTDPFVPYDTHGFHTYSLNVSGGMATLSIDAVPVATRPLGPAGQPLAPNQFAFGDGGSFGQSESELRFINYTQHSCNTPPCFQGLGDLPGGTTASYALGISADGTTVVGEGRTAASGSRAEGFRWQAATGMIDLGDLPGNYHMSRALDVSADGTVIVGYSSSGNGTRAEADYGEAFRWTEAGGMVGLGDTPGGFFCSEVYCVSSDGNVIGGQTHPGDNFFERATLWTNGSGWGPTLDNTFGRYSVFYDMTPNAQWAVGRISNPLEAVRWSSATGFQNIGDLPGGSTLALALGVSQDGSTVVGYGSSASGQEAFRWTEAGGMTGLGDLPGGGFASVAEEMSADGTLIVGSGTSAIGQEAAIWDASLAVERLADVLAENGVALPLGWTLTVARDITVNAGVVSICGYGTNPSGNTEAWIARYSIGPPCEAADIVQSPSAATAPFGGSVQLQVTAGGTGPLTYQWRKDNVPLTDGPVGCGGTISGATTDTLVLNTVTFVEGGNYDCVVTNACGTDTSTAATLTINPPPAAADVNHDGQVNGADIQALVNALLAP